MRRVDPRVPILVCIQVSGSKDDLQHFAQIADCRYIEQVEEDVLPFRDLVVPV